MVNPHVMGSHDVMPSSVPVDWSAAERECARQGNQLAVVDSVERQRVLEVYLRLGDYQHENGRLGLWFHDDVIKWKHFPRYWPFVRGIHRSTVNSPHKGQ